MSCWRISPQNEQPPPCEDTCVASRRGPVRGGTGGGMLVRDSRRPLFPNVKGAARHYPCVLQLHNDSSRPERRPGCREPDVRRLRNGPLLRCPWLSSSTC